MPVRGWLGVWQLESASPDPGKYLRWTRERDVCGFSNGLWLSCLDELDLGVSQGYDIIRFNCCLLDALITDDNTVR